MPPLVAPPTAFRSVLFAPAAPLLSPPPPFPPVCTTVAAAVPALVETALGLVVAIPAVWFYNYLTGRVEYFNVEMDNSSSELVDFFIRKTA